MPILTVNLSPENSLTVIRGASKTLDMTITDTDTGRAADLTGGRIVLTVKESVTDARPVIQKISDEATQAEITLPRSGIARIYLVPADTQNLTLKDYVFDVWVILASGKRYHVIQPSVFTIQPGVTLQAL